MNIGEMQRKLSLWAEQDKERKFYDLYNLTCREDWLRLAQAYVAQNAGSKTAGCDGIDMSEFEEDLDNNLGLKQAKIPSPQGIYLLVDDDVPSLSCLRMGS